MSKSSCLFLTALNLLSMVTGSGNSFGILNLQTPSTPSKLFPHSSVQSG